MENKIDQLIVQILSLSDEERLELETKLSKLSKILNEKI